MFSTSRMHWSDLKGYMKRFSCFCHFEESIMTRFSIFCRFRYLYYYEYTNLIGLRFFYVETEHIGYDSNEKLY